MHAGGWSTVTAEPTVLVVVDDTEGQHVARSARPASWAPWRWHDADPRGHAAVWVAWVTLATYWGLVVASFLLRAINDPTTDVGSAVLTRLGWGGLSDRGGGDRGSPAT